MDHNLFFSIHGCCGSAARCQRGLRRRSWSFGCGPSDGGRKWRAAIGAFGDHLNCDFEKHEEAHAAAMSVRYIRTRVFPAVFAFFSLHPNENATVLEMARTIHAASAPASTEWDAARHLSLGDHEVRLQDALKLAGMAICRNLQIRACSQHIVQGNGRRCKAPRDWSMDFSAPA